MSNSLHIRDRSYQHGSPFQIRESSNNQWEIRIAENLTNLEINDRNRNCSLLVMGLDNENFHLHLLPQTQDFREAHQPSYPVRADHPSRLKPVCRNEHHRRAVSGCFADRVCRPVSACSDQRAKILYCVLLFELFHGLLFDCWKFNSGSLQNDLPYNDELCYNQDWRRFLIVSDFIWRTFHHNNYVSTFRARQVIYKSRLQSVCWIFT